MSLMNIMYFYLLLGALYRIDHYRVGASPTQAEIDKGRRIYFSNCISCHNKDPNLKGAIGPEIINVPYEVLESKILTGKYPEKLPPGFIPKRKTKLMKPIPKIKDDIKALHAWIESMNKQKK